MKFTVETIEMNYVMITFESGEKFFYSLDEMTIPKAVDYAISAMLEA